MAARGRPKVELLLSGDERASLEGWARRPASAQVLTQRCRIVLACAEGLTNQQVAAAEGVNQDLVDAFSRGHLLVRQPGHGRQVAGAFRLPAP
jgi:DNA-binding NarL/FixJ family response regulator